VVMPWRFVQLFVGFLYGCFFFLSIEMKRADDVT